MPDLEKVIKGLEEAYQIYLVVEGRGILVDSNENEYALIAPVLMRDAIALLKAQEPVKPIVGHNIGPTWWYACGECKGAIDIGDKFCRHCGRELKWES